MARTFRKYIVYHDVTNGDNTTRFVNCIVIPNHYDHSLASFAELVAEARKTFPDLKDDDAACLTVVQSGSCKNCPALRFPRPPIKATREPKPKDGWTVSEYRNLDIVLS